MKLRTLIIDDEASARSRLRKLLSAYPEVEIVGEAQDGLEALNRITETGPDLLLLDVQMPAQNGFEVLDSLPVNRIPLVIFATAYDEYALAAFAANAIGYLLKPIKRERLNMAIERASKLLNNETGFSDEREKLRDVVKQMVPPLRQIVARRRDRFVLLSLERIFYFRIESGLLRARTVTESYWTDYQINDLESRLPSPPFLRVDRSAIVNLDHVREIVPFPKSTYLLLLNDSEGTEIRVSERRSKKLRELLRS